MALDLRTANKTKTWLKVKRVTVYLISVIMLLVFIFYANQAIKTGEQWIADASDIEERIADDRILPAHNVTAKHHEWSDSIGALERRIPKLSPWDRRQAREVIGRLYASLGESDLALHHFSRAGTWEKLSSKAALTYVTLLTEAYSEDHSKVTLSPGPPPESLKENVARFVAPWFALLGGRFDEALNLVRQLQTAEETALDILRLESRLYAARGIARYAANRPEEALLDFRLSLLAEEQLQRAFPSDRRTYLAQAGVYARMMAVETDHTDHQISAYLAKALTLCSVAALIRPEDCSVSHMRAGLHQAMVRHIEKNQGDAAYHRNQARNYHEEAVRRCGDGSTMAIHSRSDSKEASAPL